MMKLRALVTRPRHEAATLAALLAERDIDAVIEPMIDIVNRTASLPDLGNVRAILCTSANGVRALARVSSERGAPVFAVGDATARAALAAGFDRVESAGGDVEDLARLVTTRLRPAEGRLLHVAGSEVAGDLAGRLAVAGFAVDRAALYEARAATTLTPETAELIDRGEIDLALFFSPRSATIFARLAARVAAGLSAVTAISISTAADAALGDLPFRERLIAAAPTQVALLARIDEFAGQIA
jgi:uroporphyrinogen-III synthase